MIGKVKGFWRSVTGFIRQLSSPQHGRPKVEVTPELEQEQELQKGIRGDGAM